jgi:hypothetical protein
MGAELLTGSTLQLRVHDPMMICEDVCVSLFFVRAKVHGQVGTVVMLIEERKRLRTTA